MLYQTQYVRPTAGVSLLVDVTGKHDDTHVEGSMTIGGEQRQASNRMVQVTDFPQRPASLSGAFKVIFLTPAYFKQGWLPEAAWKDLFGVNVELKGAALYRPQRIGGWNSAAGNGNGAQRTMHNYVAPGSVYYFKTDESFEPHATLTETPPGIASAADIGFGQVAYTTWTE
jgi:CRISPR-associated protein Cmr3